MTEELCGTSFSKSTVSTMCSALDPAVVAFCNRPLEKWYPFVLVDAIFTKVREGGQVRSKGLMILSLLLSIRQRLRTTNGLKRLNEELRRRERVIKIFPNEQAI